MHCSIPPLPLEEGVCNALILVDVQTKVSQRHLRSFRGVVGPGFAQKLSDSKTLG